MVAEGLLSSKAGTCPSTWKAALSYLTLCTTNGRSAAETMLEGLPVSGISGLTQLSMYVFCLNVNANLPALLSAFTVHLQML